MKKRVIYAADLFCGAGGFSSGLINAAAKLGAEVELVAINHWDVAIQTHSANHANVRHLCQTIESVNPNEVVPGGRLDLLMASPECTHFSTARGGKPMSEQSRCTVWCVLRWLEKLDVDCVLIENVPEFQTWGPLHPCTCGTEDPKKHRAGFKCLRPVEKRKGAYFRNFLRNLRTLGYRVDWRVLNAADYGGATSRERFFLMARKDRKKLVWPEPTHQRITRARTAGQITLGFGNRAPWRAAREIIDWSIRGHSIYLPPEQAREFRIKRPLADNTLRRIFAGLPKFCGLPFLIGQQSGAVPRSVNEPIPTVAGAGAISLAEPFLVVLRNHGDAASINGPLPAVCANGQHLGLAQPYLVNMKGRSDAADVNAPAPTITAHAPHLFLAEPYLGQMEHNGKGNNGHTHRCYSSEKPLPTIAGKAMFGLAEPYLVSVNHGPEERARSLDGPLPTLTQKGTQALVAPYLVEFHGERKGQEPRCQSVEAPLGTVAASRTHGLCEPFVVPYYGTAEAVGVDSPLPTVTTRDRLGLVSPELVRAGQVDGHIIGWLDILFRMLQPHELAGGMGFPKTYSFAGTREQKVRQIGNAVEVNQAEALCLSALKGGTQ